MNQSDEVYDRITQVFAKVFDEMPAHIGPETVPSDIPEWDSINHVNVVLALESEFDVKFTSAQIQSMDNVGHIAELIRLAQKKR